MQKLSISLTFCLCVYIFFLSGTFVFGQSSNKEIEITLTKKLLNKTKLSGLIFSNEYGIVKAFHKLDKESASDRKFNVSIPKDEKVNLSFLHLYPGLQSDIDREMLSIMTVLDIQNGQIMDAPEDYKWIRDKAPEVETIRMTISGCKSIEDLIIDRKRPHLYLNYNHKKSKHELRLKYDKLVGEDIYVLIKANGESYYRYLYLDDDEQVPLTAPFETLNSDLTTYRIKAPFSGRWKGYISKKNEFTGTECILYSAQNPYPETDEFIVYVPEDRVTGPYYIELSPVWSKVKPENNRIIRDLYNEIPTDLSIEDTWVEPIILESSEYSFFINGTFDFFILNLAHDMFDLNFGKTRQRLLNWNLMGLGQEKINFRAISFTPEILAAFPILEEVSLKFSEKANGTTFEMRESLSGNGQPNPYMLSSSSWRAKNVVNSRMFFLKNE